MSAEEEATFRKVAATMVRQWADKRLVAGTASGTVDRFQIGTATRDLFEKCADDIERGVR